MKKKARKRLVILMFLLPSICGFIFFQVFPIVYSFVLSLTDWDVLRKANFIGFENYKTIFASE
ncbi:MAG: sugar ABC transporter permease, partial [Thermotogaceae bacterium]|nr:sugar ABC transporter permease [Thermotogaceae bacterium]